jgi:hypothetical protein
VTEIVVLGAEHAEEVLRRQIHPAHFVVGSSTQIERTAFTPRWSGNEPEGDMSHLRGNVPPQDAWSRYRALKLDSAGTWGVAVGEALEIELEVADDSSRADRPSDHAYIKIEPGRRGYKSLARHLAAKASERGCLYRPEPEA